MPRRVLIVEGHARVRTALAARLALVPQVRVVGAVASVGEAVRLGQAQPPDVVLYDPHTVTRLGTDGVDGATGLRVLTLQGWPVIVLIAVLDAAEAAVLEGSGAVALLRKGRPTRVLLQALETAVRAAPGRTRLADDPERWRALALLDQWQAAAACPGTVAAGDRPAAELAPAGRPVCPEAVACAARRARVQALVDRSAHVIARGRGLVARSAASQERLADLRLRFALVWLPDTAQSRPRTSATVVRGTPTRDGR